MAYADLLTHKATIRRRATQTDRFGQKSSLFQPHATGVACRVTGASGGESNTDVTVGVVSESFTLYVLSGQDIKEDDRVSVTTSDNAVLVDDAEILHVKVITGRAGIEHHRECALKVIRGNR